MAVTVESIRSIIPIASGKGGVGKSTVSANLALALARAGARVGLMDADVYGPSIPTMLGIGAMQPAVDGQQRINPVTQDGVKVVSMAFFMKPGEAVIWRGPMLHKTVEQFLGGVNWGELDYLLVDLPPGCLTSDTLVFTDRGPLPINQVQVGCSVYSFSGQFDKPRARTPWALRGNLSRRKVLAVIPQGRAVVYKLRTATRSIRGTADHPMLVVRRKRRGTSRSYDYTLEWQELASLKPGDRVLVVKKLPQARAGGSRLPRPSVNGRVSVRIPERSEDNLLRVLGYCLGDGTVRKTREGHYWGVWFSEPEGGTYRSQYVRLLKKVFSIAHVHEEPRKFAVLSNQVAELCGKLGLEHHALAKTVPPWVFLLPGSQKLAFIEGYCDADGHRRQRQPGHRRAGWMCFESPNRPLLAGLRALCMDVGLKIGNLNARTRRVQLPSTRQFRTQTFYFFEANRAAKTDIYGAGLIRGRRIGRGLRNEYVGFERVREVTQAGFQDVYDLQVEGEHNFVADGFVVHNTGDVQLSLCQSIPITGAVIVSTPQDVALQVAQKAMVMFKKLNAPVLGLIENMASYVCPHCGNADNIFGSGGARRVAERLGVPFLGEIPLATPIREASDAGRSLLLTDPGSPPAKAFLAVAEQLVAQVSSRGAHGGLGQQPKVTF